jgi:rhodanese-related sulfurtransferase
MAMATAMQAAELKAAFADGQEIALLDAREEVPFDARHLLMAACVPLGQLEVQIDALVPRRDTRVVYCDDGEGFAQSAADQMIGFGYSNVHILHGGIDAWEHAGYPMYSGVHVPSKAFAEVVEHEAGTPWISAEELQALIDKDADMVILDSRTYEEYHGNSIPGAISVPGAELVHCFKDLVPSQDTLVVVNCGGRTRSIIGAQALINAGFDNQIVSLKNGTQDWHLGGFEIVVGAQRRVPAVSAAGLMAASQAASRIATQFSIDTIDAVELARLQTACDARNLYVLDVRTEQEYARGHLRGSRLAPGGQLVQETDRFLAVWGGRVVLVDDNGIRATVAASWLKQMGWNDVLVHQLDAHSPSLQRGAWQPQALGLSDDGATDSTLISAAELRARQADSKVTVVDLSTSHAYRQAHIPGAWFALRTYLSTAIATLPAAETLVFSSEDGTLARLAARDMQSGDEFASVHALSGGSQAWREAGFDFDSGTGQMASPADDIRLKARDMGTDIEAAMRAYLAWEIGLVEQMATDEEQRFRVGAASS